jgi:hypothetical protein
LDPSELAEQQERSTVLVLSGSDHLRAADACLAQALQYHRLAARLGDEAEPGPRIGQAVSPRDAVLALQEGGDGGRTAPQGHACDMTIGMTAHDDRRQLLQALAARQLVVEQEVSVARVDPKGAAKDTKNTRRQPGRRQCLDSPR